MPDIGATVVRGILQNVSMAYKDNKFVGSEVFPEIMLPTNKAKVTIYNRGDWFRNEVKERQRGDVTPTSDYKLDFVNVDTAQYPSKHMVTDEDQRDAGIKGVETPPVDLRQDSVEMNAHALNMNREIITADFAVAQNWGGSGAAGGEGADAKWVASSGNTFLTDVDTRIGTLEAAGIPTDHLRLLVDSKTYRGILRISDVTDVMSYTATVKKAPGLVVSPQMMADFLNIDKVVVPGGVYSTDQELKDGTDFTSAAIWGGPSNKGYALLYYYPPKAGRKIMSAGYTAFTKMPNGAKRQTTQWREEAAHSWFYETQEEFGLSAINLAAGFAWKNTHTA